MGRLGAFDTCSAGPHRIRMRRVNGGSKAFCGEVIRFSQPIKSIASSLMMRAAHMLKTGAALKPRLGVVGPGEPERKGEGDAQEQT